ncbi:MAG: hypothetical protein U0T73_01155 [Chitinophagales bacterium]
MSILDQLKQYLYRSVIEQRRQLLAPHRIVNMAQAASIGIIYDSTPPSNDIVIAKFAEALRNKGKKVEVFAFLNDKKTDRKADVEIFNRNAVNWYGIPTDEKVSQFCKKKFDLLLCAYNQPSPPLEYIAMFSQAQYRVGCFHEQKTKCYDLMIQTGSNTDLQYLLQRMLITLDSIQTK